MAQAEGKRRSAKAKGTEALRAIPVDHEAERAVLGAIMLDAHAYHKIEDKIQSSSFDHPRHRLVFEAIEQLIEKQQGITLITLRNHLKEHGLVGEAGGVGFLSGLVDAVPTAAHVEHHAEIVREKSLSRALIRTCEGIASRGYEGGESASELVAAAEREVLQIAMGHVQEDFTDIGEQLQDTFEYIERLQSGQVSGISTGFDDLDEMTGGFEGGDLVVLAARPSMGKTALALNIARNHCQINQGVVAVFSLEMTKRQLVLRLLMGEAQVDFARFRRGLLTERDMRQLTNSAGQLEAYRMFIDDTGTLNVSDIAAKSRRLNREQKLSLIIVDYIQLIQGRGRNDERREQEVADISRSLKLLAKELDVPVIALSQLNRGPEMRPNKRPQLGDLRESGAIEQDADLVLFIYRDEVYNEETPDEGIAELIISKQRQGPTGTVRLQFEGKHARFNNLSPRNIPPPEAGFSEPEPTLSTTPGGGWGEDTEPPF